MDKAPPTNDTGVRLYHNTKKLLENYRVLTFILNTKRSIMDAHLESTAEVLHCSVEELLSREQLYGEECFDGRNELKEQIQFLQKMLQKINAAFELLKNAPGYEKYYLLLKEKYMEPPDPNARGKWSIGKEEVAKTTYYRQLQKATTAFDHILWEISDAETSNLFVYNIDTILNEWYGR